jgi:hypothetical protein
METFPDAGTLLSDYITDHRGREAPGYLQMNLQHNPYHPLATCEEYKYIQCPMIKKDMKSHYDNVLNEVNTTLGF